ncbi:MAG: polysaccharide biosynthesis tyrosine autokinase [Aquabacterium sp.]|jgi:protein-tyrosine kinase|nr:MAG: polysaccharide biosynthesis tyrosine autokinase [Aquabacterium sp.]TAL26135.1 MAG: polysaccharide biosynthesis tyrosine autokinase [Aquabacterium sp.]
MAVFRDSRTFAPSTVQPTLEDELPGKGQDHSIGDIIRHAKNLSAVEVERILAYQKEKGLRFGEAAVALGYASNDDVLQALSKQYHYPITTEEDSPVNRELITAHKPFSREAESFRNIRSLINNKLTKDGDAKRALAVVSPDVGDGKSYFAANLAVVFSQLGGRTLLVDADLRNPRQHEIFGVNNATGLSAILSGRATKNVVRSVRAFPSLFVMPVGNVPPNPLELVERPAFGLLMHELINKFDYVIVDTPAAVHGADAVAVAARCGSAIVIARKGQSRVEPIQNLVTELQDTSAKLLGSVFNDF